MQTEQQSLRAAAGQRFWQIDALRGLALLNMLVYHAMYDWVYIFGHASGWYDIWSTHCHVWQQYICWSFILLCCTPRWKSCPRWQGLRAARCCLPC